MHISKLPLIGLIASIPSLSAAAPVQWAVADGGNGHWYDFVTDFSTWSEARTAALGMSFMGLDGYLATITSQEEQDFLSDNWVFDSNYWLGGSDAASEGDWLWVDGPEAGQNIGGSNYENWDTGEPNNSFFGVPPENYLYGWVTPDGAWNDNPGTQEYYYLVEFGGVNPAAVPIGAPAIFLLSSVGALAVLSLRKRSNNSSG